MPIHESENMDIKDPTKTESEEQTETAQEETVVEETAAEEPTETIETQATPSETPKGLIGQVKRIGAPISGKIGQLKSFIVECQRVLRVTKKPSREEYQTIVKISAIGMAIIGLLGFAIHAMKELLF